VNQKALKEHCGSRGVVQIAVATLLGIALALYLGWGIGAGLVFGLALVTPPKPASDAHHS
jgi:predicted Kef-type K+ transport protein